MKNTTNQVANVRPRARKLITIAMAAGVLALGSGQLAPAEPVTPAPANPTPILASTGANGVRLDGAQASVGGVTIEGLSLEGGQLVQR